MKHYLTLALDITPLGIEPYDDKFIKYTFAEERLDKYNILFDTVGRFMYFGIILKSSDECLGFDRKPIKCLFDSCLTSAMRGGIACTANTLFGTSFDKKKDVHLLCITIN